MGPVKANQLHVILFQTASELNQWLAAQKGNVIVHDIIVTERFYTVITETLSPLVWYEEDLLDREERGQAVNE